MCLATTEWISAGKDVVLALAAIATVIVAISGLNTWNRQLRGTAGFDVARALAKATYAVRDKLQACRSPLLMANEFPQEFNEAGIRASAEQKAKAYAHLYSNRWRPVWEAMQQFDATLLEAEALWGRSVRDATNDLRRIVREVNVAIDAYISDAASGGEDFSSDREFGKKMRSTVAAVPTDTENAVNQKLSLAIKAIDDALRPHLKRS